VQVALIDQLVEWRDAEALRGWRSAADANLNPDGATAGGLGD